MKNIDNKVSIILSCFIVLVLILYIVDFCIYKKEFKDSAYCTAAANNCPNKYAISNNYYVYSLNINDYGRYKTNVVSANPVLVFGSAFAGGYNEIEKAFPSLFDKYTSQSVIDRTFPGGGLQSMYFQSTQDEFYNIVPKTNKALYLLTYEDLYNALIPTSSKVAEPSFKLHYYLKNNKLYMSDYNNKIINFFRSTYLVKLINKKYVEKYINNDKNKDKITDLEVKYFVDTRNNLQEHWNNNIDFVVVIYDYVAFKDLLINKLTQKGFKVIDFSNVSLGEPNYRSDVLFPLIAKQLNIN